MKRFLILAAAMAAGFSNCFAADATFSKDCRHVYLAPFNGENLIDIDLAAKSWRLTNSDLPKIKGVTLSNAGLILCACSDSIWSLDPSNGKCAKVCDAPKGVTLRDIAYDPKTEMILTVGTTGSEDINYGAEGEASAFCLIKGARELTRARSRYGTNVGHPVFSADGTLFFECLGDLWMGSIYNGNDDVNDPALDLDAYRCAPLASIIEENITPPSTGINDIAVSRGFIYARYVRMGGSGWGETLRFLRPPPLPQDTDYDPAPAGDPDWKGLARLFASVKYVNPLPFKYLCASRDGSLIFYAGPYHYREHLNQDEAFLVKHDGKPIPLEIKDLETSDL
jgi:hypothetical protein